MKHVVTTGIVLARTDFQEADRIITLLTSPHGKIRVMAKGVRRVKSKLAGGIELFSISDITYIPGRGDIDTLVSTRLQRHFGKIVKDIDRTMLGYELLKRINAVTEEAVGKDFFDLISAGLESLDDKNIPLPIIELWFAMQLLKITGHAPNLRTTADGKHLSQDSHYNFDIDTMTFEQHANGTFSPNEIKVLRLAHRASLPQIIANVTGAETVAPAVLPLAKTILKHHLHI